MRLSLVVPATDSPPTLARCLEAMRAATNRPDELVIVATPAFSGPAAARNAGAEEAAGDVVVFVDSDVLVHPDAFTRIRAAFAADPELIGVFGSYDDAVVTRGTVAGFRNLLHHVVHQRSAGDAVTFWAGLGAVRRDAFHAVGGFDEKRYRHASIEDIELGGRLSSLGRVVLDPHLRGTHLNEWTLGSMVRTDFSRRGVPWVALMAERRSVPSTLNVGLRERASALAAVAAVGGLLARRPGVAGGALVASMALNMDLYGTLGRRLGPRGVAAGIPLHILHQLVGVASVPAGLAVAVARRPRRLATSAPVRRGREPTLAGSGSRAPSRPAPGGRAAR